MSKVDHEDAGEDEIDNVTIIGDNQFQFQFQWCEGARDCRARCAPMCSTVIDRGTGPVRVVWLSEKSALLWKPRISLLRCCLLKSKIGHI